MAFKEIASITDALVDLGDDSRLWIFQADRSLSNHEQANVQRWLDDFMPKWTSHNRSLKAKSVVAYDRFIIVALDEVVSNAASGCSIDSMTHHIQAIANQLSINLMDRVTFCFMLEDQVQGIHMNEVSNALKRGAISEQSLVFNNLIKTKRELASDWLIPINQSWQKRFL